ncbi:hypothetical protein PNA2_0563 [Pyrococcus sp. NA2]|uniref:MBL fold metallo-hydrolase n=1 Tax=Pyrococcus sp. (strain NA2) TaxID=342949 RepID=UPI000209ABB0|nr:MBL fold metallo-hydrolase [Pyrococcus sp. NA2]AEC51479.1 hypothetical protein PNA2_0563 [Pyrococcus sp. NA2]
MVEEVLPGIYRILDSFVNVYLIDAGDHLILIDTGIESTCEKVEKAVNKIGKPLRTIVITHGHLDHVGSLACLKEKFNPKIAAHRNEFEMIKENTGVEPDMELKDGEEFEGLKIFHKPGHTAGSICILYGKTLFVGDLLMEKDGRLEEIPQQYSQDPKMNRQRIMELLEIDFENLMPAHGEPVIGSGKEKLKELVERLKDSDL